MFNAPEGRYKQDVYLLPKKMGKLLNIAATVENFSARKVTGADTAPYRGS